MKMAKWEFLYLSVGRLWSLLSTKKNAPIDSGAGVYLLSIFWYYVSIKYESEKFAAGRASGPS